MSYYNSSYYAESNYGENNFNFNPYAIYHDYVQVPSFMNYNSYDYDYNNQPNYSYGYDSSLNFSDHNNSYYHDHSYNQNIAYSAINFSDSKSLVYEPNYGMSQLVLSYNTLEFNEPSFDEYDPTPYGGGYDISATYGKPLPPSDKICYPRSGSTSIPIVSVPLEEEVKIAEEEIKPENETAEQVSVEMPQLEDSTKKDGTELNESDEDNDEDSDEDSDKNDEEYSGSSYGDGYGEYEKEVSEVTPQYPSGYGLEAVDICESLFGWPCLSKMKREKCCAGSGNIHRDYNWDENVWKETADYLFGMTYPYSGRRDDED